MTAQIPRYIRVNTLAWSLDEALESLRDQGFTLGNPFESE
jgi:25S rRNA (cytosine2278-C5)-methyltransferase